MARIYIDRNTGRLSRTDLYFVALALKDGTVIEPLEPRRLFPLSNQNEYIALLDKNEKEVALIRHVEDLDEESAKVLQDCFADYYRIPRILRLLTSDDRFGALTWCVQTDCGMVTFRIRNRHSDIKVSPDRRVLVRDTNDNRYEISDYEALDAHSRHLLFSYL